MPMVCGKLCYNYVDSGKQQNIEPVKQLSSLNKLDFKRYKTQLRTEVCGAQN